MSSARRWCALFCILDPIKLFSNPAYLHKESINERKKEKKERQREWITNENEICQQKSVVVGILHGRRFTELSKAFISIFSHFPRLSRSIRKKKQKRRRELQT